MNKYVMIMILVFFMFVIAQAAYSLEIANQTLDDIQTPTSGISGIVRTLRSVFSLMTFRYENVPIFFNWLFISISFGVAFLIIDVLKDLIPTT